VSNVTLPTAVKLLSNILGRGGWGIETVPERATERELLSVNERAGLPLPISPPVPTPPAVPPLVSLEAKGETVATILNRLVQQDPAYTWEETDGLINVYRKGLLQRADYPLNCRIRELAVTNVPQTSALWKLFTMIPYNRGDLRILLPPQPSPREQPVSVELREVSVRQALNEIARKISASWCAELEPGVEQIKIELDVQLTIPRGIVPPRAIPWELVSNWPLERFEVNNVALITALKDLARRVSRFRFGFDNLAAYSHIAEQKPLNLSLEHTTLKEALDALVAADGRFVWREQNGFVNVYPRLAAENADYPLDWQLPKLVVPDVPPDEAIFLLTQQPEVAALHLDWGGEGGYEDTFGYAITEYNEATGGYNSVYQGDPDRDRDRDVPIHVVVSEPLSLRDALNRIAQTAGTSWILRSATEGGRPWLSLGGIFAMPRTVREDGSVSDVRLLDLPIQVFRVEQLTVPEAVMMLGNAIDERYRGARIVPYGLCCPHDPSEGQRVSLHLQDTSLRRILDELTAADPTYTWENDQGVVNIHPRQPNDPVAQILQRQVKRFCLLDAPVSEVLAAWLEAGWQQPGDPPIFPMAKWSPRPDKIFLSVVEEGTTVQHLLNTIVGLAQHVWLLTPTAKGDTVTLSIGKGFGIPAEIVGRYTISVK